MYISSLTRKIRNIDLASSRTASINTNIKYKINYAHDIGDLSNEIIIL